MSDALDRREKEILSRRQEIKRCTLQVRKAYNLSNGRGKPHLSLSSDVSELL